MATGSNQASNTGNHADLSGCQHVGICFIPKVQIYSRSSLAQTMTAHTSNRNAGQITEYKGGNTLSKKKKRYLKSTVTLPLNNEVHSEQAISTMSQLVVHS